jgi:transposase
MDVPDCPSCQALRRRLAELEAQLQRFRHDKVYGGNRTASGAAAQGVLTSVLRTCRQQGLAAVDFASRTLRAFGNRLLPTPTLLATR